MPLPARRCSATVYGPRVHSWQCQLPATREYEGKPYCTVHDPLTIKARDDARHRARRSREAQQDDICRRMRKLARTLGVRAEVHYHSGSTMAKSGYREALVISREELEKLVARMAARGLL